MESLWGEEFDIEEKVKTKKILNKIREPKTQNIDKPEKAVKSKKADLSEKLSIIRENVYKTLGNQVDNVQVIYDREEFHNYITEAIKIGTIAIDTETNNSTDPITCQIVGLCLYSEGLKQAYIPINHIDRTTKIRFDNQCTESDVKEELQRIVEAKTFVLMHNGKFDYQVIKCTCDIEVQIDWDTLIAAKCLDENEKNAGLKQQYIEKIDGNQEKYSFDQLFEKIPNNLVEPELFALYAATDSLMTYRLYQWQKERFEQPGNEKLYNMFRSLETPLVKVLAEMELAGMEVDQEYAKLLSDKFHKRLEIIDNKLALELEVLKPKIDAWRLTDEANYRPAKKTGTGEGKSKSEQLEDPINLGSPTQLAILFYDILKCPQVSKKSPRGTGEGELELISEKLKLPICNLLIDTRELVKLISTYIDVIPETVKIWPDHRLRTHFNQYGAATGILSSGGKIMYTDSEDVQHTIGGVNFQNIPANEKTIRMLFKARNDKYSIESENNIFVVNSWASVETRDSYKYADTLKPGDILIVNDTEEIEIKKIIAVDNTVKIVV